MRRGPRKLCGRSTDAAICAARRAVDKAAARAFSSTPTVRRAAPRTAGAGITADPTVDVGVHPAAEISSRGATIKVAAASAQTCRAARRHLGGLLVYPSRLRSKLAKELSPPLLCISKPCLPELVLLCNSELRLSQRLAPRLLCQPLQPAGKVEPAATRNALSNRISSPNEHSGFKRLHRAPKLSRLGNGGAGRS